MLSSGRQPHPANPLKRPRQDPVSCQFCRSKKLKCNRQQPCSNCATRGLACEGQFQPYSRQTPASSHTDNVSILARLKRLEDIVIGSSNSTPHVAQPKIHSPRASLSPDPEYEEAVHNLEGTGTSEDSWISLSSKGFEFGISSTHQISINYGIFQNVPDQLSHCRPATKWYSLPRKEEAVLLMDHYVKYLDGLQHVVYIPTVRRIMDSIYANLEKGLPVIHSHVALLLSIFASSSMFSSHFDGGTRFQFSPSDASQASLFWANAALEVLEFSRRTASRRLEDVQTTIILAFLLYHIEGFSTRSRCLFANAITTARDLSLHKLDARPGQIPGSRCQPDHLETEISRRVWWHVVATDWYTFFSFYGSLLISGGFSRLLSLSGGPQEGTYFLQPRHMCVNIPCNVNDSDLTHDKPPVNLPLSEPTTMSYYIQRIKLADICRNVVDVMPLNGRDLALVDYQDVIALDDKFEAFFQELPVFFQTDEKSRLAAEPIMCQYPALQVQRYALRMIADTRRCKLHQPFLIRGSVDPNYAYSREISLKSARSCIRVWRLHEKEYQSILVASVKLTGVVHHVFMATIVLVMDLCFNKTAGDDAERKAEVREACKILEDVKCQSRMAHEFLESLMDILRTHKVRLHNNPPPGDSTEEGILPDSTGMPQRGNGLSTTPAGQERQSYDDSWPPPDNPQNYLSDFDEIWKDYVEFGPNMDMPEWDNLFSDLDSRY
ncbi:uncharacterized protein Z518_02306 [Rhinocladiella mackenziei CBS 650.93]|uniref:Zn(2)-C6 fungal-type domain-containing protein n=1 Tax=Rhinocladiella mackenziei CBS 650.93 TaxID=1442369 RepID=A0A0D2HB39_9EURO|nr:uncharacterized protein Z518_02306 [Rhinocladiella mackenziei CBS 650.93]KIX07653.1 hypothetical protein Z518_02306 [Rhinocladiella mackenziei CBS 650.93]